jgi:ABC-type branched-subunit amino acid transport system ATPase component
LVPLLEVSQIVAGYGETVVLRGVSMLVASGELVTIIGPNGSGKSTLLKTIFGLVKPRQGVVRFQGRDITSAPTEQMAHQGLSYIPQSSNVFPSLTVQENLEMGAFVRQGPLIQRREEMYALFPDLGERRTRKAGDLSGGQRQMLAFARAMMLDPQLLLLDEPSAGLSPAMVKVVFETINQIHESGVSIVIVEQNAREALRLSSRGYVLANGENRLEDNADRLLSDPEVALLYLGG